MRVDLGKLIGRWKGFRAADGGVSAVEFALAAPFLATLLLGVVDVGQALWYQSRVTNAAQAGAQYAILKGFNATAIQTAVTNATGLASIVATPAPVQSCGCPDATLGVVAASCATTCSDASTPATYVTVSAQATYTWMVPYPSVSNPMTLTSQAIVRIP